MFCNVIINFVVQSEYEYSKRSVTQCIISLLYFDDPYSKFIGIQPITAFHNSIINSWNFLERSLTSFHNSVIIVRNCFECSLTSFYNSNIITVLSLTFDVISFQHATVNDLRSLTFLQGPDSIFYIRKGEGEWRQRER